MNFLSQFSQNKATTQMQHTTELYQESKNNQEAKVLQNTK